MKDNILEYKGYHTSITYDARAGRLRGVITEEIEQEFHMAVDEYLEFCKEVGKSPCKEYKGVFNVRVKPALHKELVQISERDGETLNAVVERALQLFVKSVEKMRKDTYACKESRKILKQDN